MYERFTDRARKVLQLANQEAQRFNHEYIGTEHILLGLIKEGSGIAVSVLKRLNVDLQKLRSEVEKLLRIGPQMTTDKLPMTPRTKQAVECAIDEALNVDSDYIGTEHILLGLLRVQDGIAAQVQMKFGLKLESVRNEALGTAAGRSALGPDRTTPSGCLPHRTQQPVLSMHNRFTDRTRKVIQLANQEAQRFNHDYIGTEHILLGLIRERSGVAACVLKNLNVDLRELRLEVEKLLPSGPLVTTGKLPQTPRAQKVVEYAIEEARTLNHDYVGTEHILLGLLREQIGVAVQVLMNSGLKLDHVRNEVLSCLGEARS